MSMVLQVLLVVALVLLVVELGLMRVLLVVALALQQAGAGEGELHQAWKVVVEVGLHPLRLHCYQRG
jgi:hypothetical protein